MLRARRNVAVGLKGALVAASCALLLAASVAHAQRNLVLSPSAASERRVALVIGNDAYRSVPKLERAVADARAVAAELRRLGFEVLLRSNLDRRGMNAAIGDLVERVGSGGVALLFFAGHGVQVAGSNYLLPTDIKVSRADDLPDEAIDLGRVMERLAQASTKFSLLIIDACRDNPFPRPAGRSIGARRGLTIPAAPDGLMVLYSAGINEQALDKLSEKDTDPNSLFTREFIKQLRTPGRRADDMLRRVRFSVREQARQVGHSQNPALYDQSSGDFYFSQPPKAEAQAAIAPDRPSATPGPAATARPAKRLALFLFNGEQGTLPFSVRDVVLQDLRRRDDFQVEDIAERSPAPNQVFDEWAARFDFAVVGAAAKADDGRFEVQFRVLDLKGRSQLQGLALKPSRENLRQTGHRIADHVAEAATGASGAFTSRVIYTQREGEVYELRVADYDGQNLEYVLKSGRPILSPAWSPDARRIAYVSLERAGSPEIYVHELHSGKRVRIAQVSEKALIAWGAGRERLVLADISGDSTVVSAIAADGGSRSEIAVIQGEVEALSADAGGNVALALQRGGESSLHAFSMDNPRVERISLQAQGSIASIALVPGARRIAMLMRGTQEDRLLVLERDSGELRILVRGAELGSVTASPDGKLLGLIRTASGRSQIVQLSIEGKMANVLGSQSARFLSVAWSPKLF